MSGSRRDGSVLWLAISNTHITKIRSATVITFSHNALTQPLRDNLQDMRISVLSY